MGIIKNKPNLKQLLLVLLIAILVVAIVLAGTPLLTQPKVSAAPGDTYAVPMVSAGGSHTVALHNDGTVWAWGSNEYGQLGNNSTAGSLTPARVVGPGGVGFLADIIAVSAGDAHTVALKDDGTVWAWGANNHGQLGNNSTADSLTPVQVVDPDDITGFLADIAAISAGGLYTVALKADGTVWTWGANSDGQLGNDSSADSWIPDQVREPWGGVNYLTEIIAISAGYAHTIVLKEDGTVWAWGQNYYGQLGDGTTTSSSTPVQVINPMDVTGFLTDIVAVSAGYYHTVALKADGTVWAWGYNFYGQLGDSTDAHRYSPIQVPGLLEVAAISAGYAHTVALKADGTVWAWGLNSAGQLGNDSSTDSWIPDQVREPWGGVNYLTDIIAISAGGYHAIALKSDGAGEGTLWSWGDNDFGQLGDGTAVNRLAPVQVVYYNFIAVSAGYSHTMALKYDGTVWAWGWNNLGQLGNGSTANSFKPVQVRGLGGAGFLTDIVTVAAGNYYTVALKEDGTVWAWGYNSQGQLGDGTNGAGANRSVPVRVIDPTDDTGFLTGIMAVAAGVNNTVALKEAGTVWTWGGGLLGNGTTASSSVPVRVIDPTDDTGFLTGITAVATGQDHTVALKEDGTVWTWGYNFYGQIGDGTNGVGTNRNVPVQVIDPTDGTGFLTDIVAVAAGSYYTVALKEDGTVCAWGYNNYDQLGDGNGGLGVYSSVPVQVIDPTDVTGFLSGIIAVAAGQDHTVALKEDGTVWAWGLNINGQLGDDTETNRLAPVQVRGPGGGGFLTDIVAIAAGVNHTMALKIDGTVWGWGHNQFGQATGDTGYTHVLTPTRVFSPAPFTVLLDITPPIGIISFVLNDYGSFITANTFGVFRKNTTFITITAQDDLSGIKSIAYLLSDNVYLDAAAMSSVIWTSYPKDGFSISANYRGFAYARIADKADNITIIRSDGLVVYTDSTPAITSLSYVYASASDQDLAVTMSGNTIDKIMNGAVTLVFGVDYTVMGDVITFKAAYLDSLSIDDYTITVYYNPMGVTYVDAPGNEAPDTTTVNLMIYQPYDVIYTYSGTIPLGAPAVPSLESFAPNTMVSVAPPPTLSGYTFSGWSTASAGVSISGGSFSMPTSDVVFTGTWMPNTPITTATSTTSTPITPPNTVIPTTPVSSIPTTVIVSPTPSGTTTTPTPSTTPTTAPTSSTTSAISATPLIQDPTETGTLPTTTAMGGSTSPTTTTVAPSTTPNTKTGDGNDYWALLNLILAILGALLAVGAIIRAFFWHGKNEDRYGIEEKKTRLIWIAISVVLAIIGFVVFFLTEDMSLPMRFVDIWTIVNAVILIIGIISVMLVFKHEENDAMKPATNGRGE
ncbi:MAG: hypothetical protein FWH51_00975 [Dehalococcoidia bacterium]|nr:hypothetical protein [Dehalococcoidia bacterium]